MNKGKYVYVIINVFFFGNKNVNELVSGFGEHLNNKERNRSTVIIGNF